MAQKSLHFIYAHFLWMTNGMKADVAFNPIYVGLFGPGL